MQLQSGLRQHRRRTRLTLSEMMTIIIHFHQSGYRTFKSYYQSYVLVHLQGEFPGLISYSRFVRLMKRAVVPLFFYLKTSQGACTGISFVDSTPIQVCHTVISSAIRSSKVWQRVERQQWDGSMASSCTWRSMSMVRY